MRAVERLRASLTYWLLAAWWLAGLPSAARIPRRRQESFHVVVVAHWFPPNAVGGVHRVIAAVRALVAANCQVSVVTAASRTSVQDESLARQIPSTVRVLRVTEDADHASWRWMPRVEGQRFPFVHAVRHALQRLHATHPADVILASGPKFGQFVAATRFAKANEVPVVLDLRDEWTLNEFDFIQRSTGDTLWERRSLMAADHIAFSTHSMRNAYLRRYPQIDAERTSIVRNGWDELEGSRDEPASHPSTIKSTNQQSTRIAFFGSAGSWWDLKEFLNTLSVSHSDSDNALAAIVFDFVGTRAKSVAAAMDPAVARGWVTVTEHVEKAEAQRQMRAAAALFLPNGPQLHRVLPSKLYEYLAARRPILLYGRGGETEEILKTYPGLVVVGTGDANALREAMLQIANGTVDRKIQADSDAVDSIVGEHSREARNRELIALLQRLATGSARAQS